METRIIILAASLYPSSKSIPTLNAVMATMAIKVNIIFIRLFICSLGYESASTPIAYFIGETSTTYDARRSLID